MLFWLTGAWNLTWFNQIRWSETSQSHKNATHTCGVNCLALLKAFKLVNNICLCSGRQHFCTWTWMSEFISLLIPDLVGSINIRTNQSACRINPYDSLYASPLILILQDQRDEHCYLLPAIHFDCSSRPTRGISDTVSDIFETWIDIYI